MIVYPKYPDSITAYSILDPAPALINVNLAEGQKNNLLLINQQ